jgi:hypothetical protein
MLSEQIPTEPDRWHQSPDFGTARDLKTEGTVKIGPNPLDIARVVADQRAGHRVDHRGLGRIADNASPMPEIPASVSILTQVQCGQNGASLRLFQYTVSMREIFDGTAVWAATESEVASGVASSRETKDLRELTGSLISRRWRRVMRALI